MFPGSPLPQVPTMAREPRTSTSAASGDRLTDPSAAIYDEYAERSAEVRRHREAARQSTALAIGSGDIGTYRILMAVAHEHEQRAAEIERGRKR